MARKLFSSAGALSFTSVAISAGCAGLLGIEDAICDPDVDERCVTFEPLTLLPAGNGGSISTSMAGAGGMSGGAAGTADADAGAAGAPGGAAGAPGGAGGAGGSTTDPEGDEEEPVLSLCDRYCNTIASACPEPFEQYASPQACRAVCEKLEQGRPGDRGVNTVECRLARAELARDTGEPSNYCFNAGPGGSSVCGSDCEGYCTIMTQACPTLLGTFDECLLQCAQVPNLSGPPNNITYDVSVQAGDSIQCRLFHVSAATVDAVTHCGHASGSFPCTD